MLKMKLLDEILFRNHFFRFLKSTTLPAFNQTEPGNEMAQIRIKYKNEVR